MAVYADKKNGKLTGRFRVELQRGKNRYRKRWDSHAEAVRDEERVIALWDAEQALPGVEAQPEGPVVHTLASFTQEAQGRLWRGKAGEVSAWAHIRIIGELIGHSTPLNSFDTDKIDELKKLIEKKKKVSETTINRYLSHLRTFLLHGVDRKRMDRRVFEEIKWDWFKETEGRIRWITFEEEERIYSFRPAGMKPADVDKLHDLIFVAIETGCRRDELITCEPHQINGQRLHLWETKTDSPRTVPMSPETTKRLTRLVQQGMPSRRQLRSFWDKLKSNMGLEDDDDFVFHACRHTCATRLVDAGENIFVIQTWMGHKRVETTKRYAHVKQSNLETALDRVGDLRRKAAEIRQFSHTPPAGENDNFIPLGGLKIGGNGWGMVDALGLEPRTR